MCLGNQKRMTTLSSKSSYPRGQMEVQLQGNRASEVLATLSHEMDGNYKDATKGSGSFSTEQVYLHMVPTLTFIQETTFRPFRTKATLL